MHLKRFMLTVLEESIDNLLETLNVDCVGKVDRLCS